MATLAEVAVGRCPAALNRFWAPFAGPDAHAVVHRQYKDLAVTDFAFFARSTTFQDRVDGGFDKFIIDSDLQLHFPKQVHAEFMSAVDFRLAFLSSKALAVHHRESYHVNFRQRSFYIFQFRRLYDGDNQFHERAFRNGG